MATQTKNVSLEDLQNIVGEEHAREAAAADAVDGVAPSFVAEPGSVEETSELMKFANAQDLAVAPRGGGTTMTLGNPPRELDLILSTTRLDGVIEHVPGDQVVRVQSGMRLRDLQERLAGSDQMLGLDPPEEGRGATVGGIVAANSSGPRRYRYGTMRDLIIGIVVVLADGTVAKAGGKVVKNVAGYDLSKLFTGSLGTLGVIAEANFRLHPRPEVTRTVAVAVGSPQAAQGAAQAIMHSQAEATAVELHWDDEQKQIAVLLESIPAGIEAKAQTAAFFLKDFGEVRELSEGDLLAPPEVADDEAVVKISAPPNELSGVLDSVLGAAERRDVGARLTGHAASGVTLATLSGGIEARAEVVEELREIRSRRGGSVVLQRAPLELKKRVGTWQTSGRNDLGLMRRVKEKFDPRGGLNPGRFIGGI